MRWEEKGGPHEAWWRIKQDKSLLTTPTTETRAGGERMKACKHQEASPTVRPNGDTPVSIPQAAGARASLSREGRSRETAGAGLKQWEWPRNTGPLGAKDQ